MTLEVTIPVVALFALAQVVITNLVGLARIPNEVHFYDEGDIALRRNVRAHGNFTETVPITLMAMAAAELAGAPTWVLISGAGFLITGRALHYAVIRVQGWGPLRAVAMILTFIAMGGFPIATFWALYA